MDIKLYSFPILSDGLYAIESKVLELNQKYREGHLNEIEKSYLDFANTVLDYGDTHGRGIEEEVGRSSS